jgi:hypothetical protein
MLTMNDVGGQIIDSPKPDSKGDYGPCFRFVP